MGVHEIRPPDALLSGTAPGTSTPVTTSRKQQYRGRGGLTPVTADLPVPPARRHGRHEDLGGTVPVVLDADAAPGALSITAR